ncbi:MAG: hypothetical protein BWY80_01310 [Firmicutes bacterium ADurb.Bin456]|nr:MAG: hypothetical protein BWY80_01310 [Firmicutes bacterium ADurb.Bin456]
MNFIYLVLADPGLDHNRVQVGYTDNGLGRVGHFTGVDIPGCDNPAKGRPNDTIVEISLGLLQLGLALPDGFRDCGPNQDIKAPLGSLIPGFFLKIGPFVFLELPLGQGACPSKLYTPQIIGFRQHKTCPGLGQSQLRLIFLGRKI